MDKIKIICIIIAMNKVLLFILSLFGDTSELTAEERTLPSIDWSTIGQPIEPRSVPEIRMRAETGIILKNSTSK